MDPKDPLKPVRIESREARKIPPSPLSSDAIKLPESPRRSKLSTQEIIAPTILPKRPNELATPKPISPAKQAAPIHNPVDETGSPEANYANKKRLELASLLWGEGENEFSTGIEEEEDDHPAVPIPAESATPGHNKDSLRDELQRRRDKRNEQVKNQALRSNQGAQPSLRPDETDPNAKKERSFERLYTRRDCSFPGMITVLIPEKTFQPQKYAVRVIDLSPTGCRLETRQLDEITAEVLSKERWYARLEMLVPHRDKLKLRGRLVWARYKDKQSQIGLQFEEECPYVENLFTDTVNKGLLLEELLLRSPIIDPFPSMTPSDFYIFKGQASSECDKIMVTTSTRNTYEANVVMGRFQIKVPLIQNKTNFLSFIALKENKQSIPTPAAILHKVGIAETVSYANNNLVESFDVSPTGRQLSMTLTGSPARFFQALKAIEESLAFATEISLTLDFHGDAKKAAKKLKHLLPSDKQED